MNTAILHELTHHRPATDTGRHRLADGPLNRAVRSALEVADCAVELRDLLGDARALAPRSRDLRNLLAAAELTVADLAGEVDELGTALIQLEIVGAGR
jgi:hypothetical protein